MSENKTYCKKCGKLTCRTKCGEVELKDRRIVPKYKYSCKNPSCSMHGNLRAGKDTIIINAKKHEVK